MSVQKVFFQMKNTLQFCLFCVFLSVYLHLCIHDGFMFQKMGLAIYISTIVFCQEEGKQHGQEFTSATPTRSFRNLQLSSHPP